MSTTASERQMSANDEAIRAWDGPLYERFVRFRETVTTGLGAHGEEALRLYPPKPGQRVLDVGCGFGDTTQRIAGLVGPDGEAVGVDAAPRFIEDAIREAAEAERRERALPRCGRAGDARGRGALRRGLLALRHDVLREPRGCSAQRPEVARSRREDLMVVWRRRTDNEWLYRAQTIVEGIVARPEEYDEPTCGPGPFSMADADTTSEILTHAGFTDIALHRCDIPIVIGKDIEEALELVMALGPAGEILRLAGDRAAHLHGQVEAALREGLAEFAADGQLRAPASTWIVAASAPA